MYNKYYIKYEVNIFIGKTMDEETFIKPKNNIELGANLESLSVDELSDYIKNLQNEIKRVKNLKNKKYEALDLAKKIFQ